MSSIPLEVIIYATHETFAWVPWSSLALQEEFTKHLFFYHCPNSSCQVPRGTGYSKGSPQVLYPRFCTPAIQAEPPSLRDAQITSKFAAGIGELREGSRCEWPSQPGLTTVVLEAYGCINLLQKLTGTFIQAACPFGLQHKHTPPKSSVLNYYSPWRIKSMTKRFLESDIARHYYFTIYVIRAPRSLRHSQWSHCSKCCANREISWTSRYLHLS